MAAPALKNFLSSNIHELKRDLRLELAVRYAKAKNILGWGKMILPSRFKLPFCPLHHDLVAIRGMELTGREAPRGHAKTICSCILIPLFQALEEPETFQHYLNVQATDFKALAINRSIQVELEENPDIHELYGNQVGKEKWTAQQFVTSKGIIFSAVSAGQSIRGIHYHNIRPDYIVVDDLYNEDDINNIDATQKKNAWAWSTLYPARAQGKRTSIHFRGTAINTEDILEKMKTMAGVDFKTWRAILDWDAKKVLWPELRSFDGLMTDLSRMASTIFYREMQNERRDDSESLIKQAWLTDWEYDTVPLNEFHKLVSIELGVDPSIGKDSEADFTGVSLVYKTRFVDQPVGVYNFYIEGLWNEHLSLQGRIELLTRIQGQVLSTGHRISKANIEGIAGFKDFCAEVKRRTNIPVNEISQVKDKLTHLENKSGYFENKRVFLKRSIAQPLKDTLVHQLTHNHPKHDDLRDGTLLALPDLQPRGTWRPIE